MTTLVVQCATCVHYLTGMHCKAFDKIPPEVWFSKVSHAEPLPGDQGFQYTSVRVATAALKTSLVPATYHVSLNRVKLPRGR